MFECPALQLLSKERCYYKLFRLFLAEINYYWILHPFVKVAE